MKNIAIIQARTGATRLPNKVLMKLEDKTVLEHVIDRVSQSKLIDKVIVATTISKNDLNIVKLCAEKGINVICGSENDVLDRYYQAARLFNPENVIRITADCPMHDSHVIDEVIERHIKDKSDYSSNVLEETFPDGLDCEIMKFSVLKEAWQEAKLTSQREHVTQYIIHNKKYKKTSIVSKENHGNERWTLDTEQDLKFIQMVYKELYTSKPYFEYSDVIELLDKKPEIRKINQNSVRNEGLIKSLQEDRVAELSN
jgi:spore coat polysaccharide biosynthesis protein SpsF (cytidylyltransferase family)